ncbi:MAG: hypothetical protein B0D92_08110 [Spirochaeta sp. LUC14_002_19_P3]|nr:MAG: hypothetical protein B0D92_08110 [Spirochaeta sp. LUC14_002_19_P3]
MRKIIHIDMDAFYAAVEQRNNPKLRGKPVIVGGRPNSRGVVSTCSYEARAFGIRSAMPTAEAYRRCPNGIFISEANFGEYRRVSAQIMEIFHRVTDRVEPLSLDEAFLDLTDNKLHQPSATLAAQWIRKRIRAETGLTASAGVSYNKSLAKIASDWQKPDGLTVITPEQAEEFLAGLPVRKFFGIGPVTAGRLEKLGIHSGKDLRKLPLWRLSELFGKNGFWYYQVCRGIDDREVVPYRERKSLSLERTFREDMANRNQMRQFLRSLAKDIWDSLQKYRLSGRTVTVKVKYADFQQVTRSRTFSGAIPSLEKLREISIALFEETQAGERPVRLLGIGVSSFDSPQNSTSGELELEFHDATDANVANAKPVSTPG